MGRIFGCAPFSVSSGILQDGYHRFTCVLVVIAILAIGLFRGNLEDLWGAISEGINGLTVPQ